MGDQVPATQASRALATSFDYGNDAGVGFENVTNEDVSIPFLGVLQDMSPLVKDRTTGAIPGELFNTVTGERFDAKTGIIFQPVDTRHCYVEWKPRNQGGGFVGVHELDSEVVTKARAEQKFGEYVTKAGNDLIETFYLTGLMHRTVDLNEQVNNAAEPMVVAFTSTKIKAYKGIMTRLRTFNNGKTPLFAHRLRITSKPEKNAEGDFHNIKIEPLLDNDVAKSLIPPTLGDQPNPLLVLGKGLVKASRGGNAKVNYAGTKGDGAKGAGGAGGKDDVPF